MEEKVPGIWVALSLAVGEGWSNVDIEFGRRSREDFDGRLQAD